MVRRFDTASTSSGRFDVMRDALGATLARYVKDTRPGAQHPCSWRFGIVRNVKQVGATGPPGFGLASASISWPRLSIMLGRLVKRPRGSCCVTIGGGTGAKDIALHARDLVPRQICIIPFQANTPMDTVWSHATAYDEKGTEAQLTCGKFVALNPHKPFAFVPKGGLCWKIECYDAVTRDQIGAAAMAGSAGTYFVPPTAGDVETYAKNSGMALARKDGHLVAKASDTKFLLEAAARAHARAYPVPEKTKTEPRAPKRGYCENCQCEQCVEAQRIVVAKKKS